MKQATTLATILFFCLAACKKSSPSTSNVTLPGGYYFVKSTGVISYDSLGDKVDSTVTSYTYDAQGRSTGIAYQEYDVSINPKGQYLEGYNVSYAYTSNTVVVNDPGVEQIIYYIDPITSLADSSYTESSQTSTVIVNQFTYDNNGYRLKALDYTLNSGVYSLSIEDDYTVVSGNTVQDITYHDTGNAYAGINDTVTSTFPATALPVPAEPVISEYLSSYGVTGKPNSNLLSAIRSNVLGTITSLNYTYQFDSLNRVTTLVETVAGTGQTYATVHFLYEP